MTDARFEPTQRDLLALFQQKYAQRSAVGWGPAMRLAHDYFTPDDHYEAIVGKLVGQGTDWCDVGCGRDIFPSNPALAKALAERCRFVYGIDPDDNVRENTLVHEYFQGLVEDCPTEHTFDLITLRMVAEHVTDPQAVLGRLSRLVKPSGLVVIYTPYKWAPMSLFANVTPFFLHNPLKQLIWRTEARDTFPTQYKLNTYVDIERYAAAAGMTQVSFRRLDDCRISNAYRYLNLVELKARSALSRIGVAYPEACIISILKLRGA